MKRMATVLVVWCALGCASAEDSRDSAGIGPGGSQDFGAFRETVENGDIPTSDTLDAVGFFNEHDIELPEATCEHSVCVHADVGVMGNMINGANCTMLFIGLNSPLAPEELPRPPLDIALALDTSGSMVGPPIDNLRIGLELMLAELRPEDRLSIVRFGDDAEVLTELSVAAEPAHAQAIASLVASGATNIYDGLALAYGELAGERAAERERRVVFLSDGVPTVGFQSLERIVSLASAYAEEGITTSVVGVGTDFDAALLRELATRGKGSSYFLDNPLALRDVFVEEMQSALLPLAHDAVIRVEVEPGYQVRAVYGVEEHSLSGRVARLRIPTLQLMHRRSADDAASGRRGGGGVMIVELVADDATREVEGEPSAKHAVARVELAYDPTELSSESKRQSQHVNVVSPWLPGETPRQGYFANASIEKAFVMLNIFAGLQGALEWVEFGDPWGAAASLDSLRSSVVLWLAEHPDADIEADLVVLAQTRALLEPLLVVPPEEAVEPIPPWPSD